MQPRTPKLLWDIQDSASAILRIAQRTTFEEFSTSSDTRAAVERYFEILGEACRRLREIDPETAAHLPGLNSAIGMRNVIAHQYDDIDYEILWTASRVRVPTLYSATVELLERSGLSGSE